MYDVKDRNHPTAASPEAGNRNDQTAGSASLSLSQRRREVSHNSGIRVTTCLGSAAIRQRILSLETRTLMHGSAKSYLRSLIHQFEADCNMHSTPQQKHVLQQI
jgi:hypothetical protein